MKAATTTKKKTTKTTPAPEKPARAKHLKPIAECPHKVGDVFMVPLDQIRPSRTQPRTEFPIDDLVDTLPKMQINAVQVRWRPNGTTNYELAFGGRRTCAATALGWAEIRVELIEKSDEEIEELQLIENMAREELSPLDEAEALSRLRRLGYSTAQIAERVGKGKTRAYVARRLGLADLTEEAKTALKNNEITVDAALEFATVSDPAEQRKLVSEALAQRSAGADPISAKSARFIAQKYHLVLAKAPFPLDDAELVPAAGACTACPKRSSQQFSMLALKDDTSDERCTDASCYARKTDAQWLRTADAARGAGLTVIEGAETKKYVMWGVVSKDTGFIDLDAAGDEARDGRTWREQLGARAVAAMVVRDDVRPRYLMPRADAALALRELGIVKPRVEVPVAPAPADAAPESEERSAAQADAAPSPADGPGAMSNADIVKAAKGAVLTDDFLRALVRAAAFAVDPMGSEIQDICEAHDVPLPPDADAALVVGEIASKLGKAALIGLMVELFLSASDKDQGARRVLAEHFAPEPQGDDAEERVLEAIEDGSRKRAAIMEQAGISAAQWTRISKKLEAEGKIVGRGEKKAREYWIAESEIQTNPNTEHDPAEDKPGAEHFDEPAALIQAATEILADGPRKRDDLCDAISVREGCTTGEASEAIDEPVRCGTVRPDFKTGQLGLA